MTARVAADPGLLPRAAGRPSPIFGLYSRTTLDGDEDWFAVARFATKAARFHEDEERPRAPVMPAR